MSDATATRPTDGARLRLVGAAARYAALGAFLLLLAVNAAITPNFLTLQTLNVNLTQVAAIVIVATGMTLVIATGGIDLSVGSLMAIAGAIAPMIFTGRLLGIEQVHLAVAVAILVSLAVVVLLGAFNGWLVAAIGIQPIVATLVLFISGRGLAQVMTNGQLQSFRVPEFQWIGLGRVLGVPVQVIVMLTLVVAASWCLRRTTLGAQILAIGGNARAARLVGIPVRRVTVAVYALSGLCAGIAGLVVIAINSAADANQIGLGMELDAIAAAAVGGTLLSGGRASVWGTLLGAMTIQLLRYTLLANGVPDSAALVVQAGIIIAAVWLQNRGGRA